MSVRYKNSCTELHAPLARSAKQVHMDTTGLGCARATPCALHRRFRSIPGTRLLFGVPGHRDSRIMPSSHTRPVELLSYISCRLLGRRVRLGLHCSPRRPRRACGGMRGLRTSTQFVNDIDDRNALHVICWRSCSQRSVAAPTRAANTALPTVAGLRWPDFTTAT
jgi:hypothetical protein